MKDRLVSYKTLTELAFLAVFSFILLNPFSLSFTNFSGALTPEAIRNLVLNLGILAPIGIIVLEAGQILIAPLPPVTTVASGYTFGMLEGSVYSFIGYTLGSTLAIALSRRYGQPLAEKFVSDEHMEKFYSLAEQHGIIVFTVIFLAPGFPDDVVCYIAGLTDLDLKKLSLSASLGRIPTIAVLTFTGNGIALAQTSTVVLTLTGFAGGGILAVTYEEKLISGAHSFHSSLSSLYPYA